MTNSALSHWFPYIPEQSQFVLPRLLGDGERFDFALFDGAHWFETALMDIYFVMHLLQPEAVAVVDDPWMPVVRLAVNYACANLGCQVLPSPHKRYVVLQRPKVFPLKGDWRISRRSTTAT